MPTILHQDFEKWMRLADYFAQRHDARRGYEWKIVLGFWAAIFATLYGEFKLVSIPVEWWIIAWLAFAYFWVWGTRDRNWYDIKCARYAIDMATNVGDEKPSPFAEGNSNLEKAPVREFLVDWSRQFQLVATAGIMALASRRELPTLADTQTTELMLALVLPIGIGFLIGVRAAKQVP